MSDINTAEVLKSMADDTRLALIRNLARKNREVAGSELIEGCSEALKLARKHSAITS